jgi:hypothetical protein
MRGRAVSDWRQQARIVYDAAQTRA